MSFWDHLDELRARVTWCVALFFVGFIAAYLFSDKLLDFLRNPLFSQLPEDHRKLYYTSLFENFLVHLKISGYASLAFLSPAYFAILWRFIAPGLKEEEKKQVFPFVLGGSFFFLMGSGFAYYFLLPIGIKYFLSYGSTAEVAWLTLDNYISLILKLLFGFGTCFQLPVLIVVLAKLGLLTYENLSKQRKTAIIVITIISALVAPPDAVSMLLLMAPLYLLFEGALLVVKKLEKANTRKSI